MSTGYFGEFGGQFVAETLMPALSELESAFVRAMADETFTRELARLYREVVGRPSPLYEATRLTREVGGARILLKREDLNHTGSHKINHCIGQALLCQRMGKPRMIAETGAGQHGVATATVAALFGFSCTVYMGAEDVRRQQLNVFRMQLLGAEVVPVESGTRTLKDALNEALRDWVTRVEDTYYCLGSVTGPHPYPTLVKEFQAVVGREVQAQLGGVTPQALVACVGGGCNAMGLFAPFIDNPEVRLIGVEAAGAGLLSGAHSASLCAGETGILHGAKTLVLQTPGGQIAEAHSLAPGLDYPGVGPEHAFLKASGRANYVSITDEEAVDALQQLARSEGILCALESAHAVAEGVRVARDLPREAVVVVNLSGRGDKDTAALAERLGREGMGRKPLKKQDRLATQDTEKNKYEEIGSRQYELQDSTTLARRASAPTSAASVASAAFPPPPHSSSSRIREMFSDLAGKKALGVYMTVGDPDLATSEKALRAALSAGADFAELGVPFSDPSADGPSIQRAMEHALKQGTTMHDVVALAARLRADFPMKPLVLFGYANPFFRALEAPHFRAQVQAADGVLIVDVPPEHGQDFLALSQQLDWIRLLAPNATPERRAVVAQAARGFIYLVAVAGVTGGTVQRNLAELQAQVAALRSLSAVPICVGFGVRDEKDARELGGLADGIIVGSAFVDDLAQGEGFQARIASRVKALLRGLGRE